jgi:hypothetical protein
MALKPTSSIFTIGSQALETVAGTFAETRIDIQLNPLDNEVLAIYAVDLQPSAPEMIGGTNTGTFCQLTRRSQTALVGIDENDAIATASHDIRSGAPGEGVAITDRSLSDTPASSAIEEIAIVATSDLFLGVQGVNNVGVKDVRVKVWARRMRADSATYAALVQSELNSN